MITQENIHNAIVESLDIGQKVKLSLHYGNDKEKIKAFEQSVADAFNTIVENFQGSGLDYLSKKV